MDRGIAMTGAYPRPELIIALVAQLAEPLFRKQVVAGSNPVESICPDGGTGYTLVLGTSAERIEGSNPSLGTTKGEYNAMG